MMDIIQIVPYLPPTLSGVGDYAFLLAQELRRAHGIVTRFIVAEPDRENGIEKAESGKRKVESEVDGFPVHRLIQRSADELLRVLSADGMTPTVLLHYVGYGYEKRGCPFWLVNGLEQWRKGESDRRLVTMFHELFASGPPWRSSFWTSPLQSRLAARPSMVSDKV